MGRAARRDIAGNRVRRLVHVFWPDAGGCARRLSAPPGMAAAFQPANAPAVAGGVSLRSGRGSDARSDDGQRLRLLLAASDDWRDARAAGRCPGTIGLVEP